MRHFYILFHFLCISLVIFGTTSSLSVGIDHSQDVEIEEGLPFCERWGFTPLEGDEGLSARRYSSKVLGWMYLIPRTMEYNFKIPAVFIERQSLSDSLLLAGLFFGNLGNFFQGYQGAFDWSTYRFRDEALISFFAIIAILRGVGNTVSDTTAAVNIYIPSHSIAYVSNTVGISTDVLGFIKNVKDVFKNKNARKFAYMLCTLSRFPFIASNILSLHPDLLEGSQGSLHRRRVQEVLSVTAMGLFNMGAFIRLSLDLKEACFSSYVGHEPLSEISLSSFGYEETQTPDGVSNETFRGSAI